MLHTRRRLAAAAGVLVAAAGLAAVGAALAAGSGPATYTGCLSTAGAVSHVAKGSQPLGGSCASGTSTIRLSAGDVTSVSAGTGLNGGATGGAATLSINSRFRLPQSCTGGQLAQANGSGGWQCVEPPRSIAIDLPMTDPASMDVVSLPGGFSVRFVCSSTGRDGQQGEPYEKLDGESDAGGEVSSDYVLGGSAPVAYTTQLPAGTFVSDITSLEFQTDGQLVFRAGATVTTVTFHADVDQSAATCELAGVATTGS